MLGSYINNSYNRISEEEKQKAFAKNPIRPNEDLKTYYARTGAQYESDLKRSNEQRSIASDPNKSKGLDPSQKDSWLSETGFQQKYGAFGYSPMGGGGGRGGGGGGINSNKTFNRSPYEKTTTINRSPDERRY
jgi:hypothetical protein